MSPDTAASAADTAVQATRAIAILEHVKQNNVAYLVGTLLMYQLGFLDQVMVWGSGCIA